MDPSGPTNLLRITPVVVCWAEKRARGFVVEAPPSLNVPLQRWDQDPALGGDPVDDGRFHCLEVVSPRATRATAQLSRCG